jgi:hypothetical protein
LPFVFAYVDLFSLYRSDFRADLEAGEINGFTVNHSFLLGTTVYVVIPSLMVFCALILQPRINRIANIALGIVYAPTIIAGAIGEWNYYIIGSAIEVVHPRPDERSHLTTSNAPLRNATTTVARSGSGREVSLVATVACVHGEA